MIMHFFAPWRQTAKPLGLGNDLTKARSKAKVFWFFFSKKNRFPCLNVRPQFYHDAVTNTC